MNTNTQNLEKELKNEMKVLIDGMNVHNVNEVERHIQEYFSFLKNYSAFIGYRETINPKMEEEEQTQNPTVKATHVVSVQRNDGGRPMYRFERKLKGGFLQEISAYVPEEFVRISKLEHNCYLYADPMPGKQGKYRYELAKESEDTECPGRVQIDYCLVKKGDHGKLFVDESYVTGTIRIDEAPYQFIIDETQSFNNEPIQEGNVIDIAYPVDHPSKMKVIWKHPMNEVMQHTELNKTAPKKYKKTTKPAVEIERTLEGKTILVVGNEPDKANYRQAIEMRGGELLFADYKEDKLQRIEARVRNADAVICIQTNTGHIGKEKVMEYCKDYNVPFRNSCEGGVSSTVRYAEELLEEQTAIA